MNLEFRKLLIIAFACFILFVIFPVIMSCIGGWHELSKKYRFASFLDSLTQHSFLSGNLRRSSLFVPVSYRACLTICITEIGLHLSILSMLRLMHPPLFIPWQSIAFCQPKKSGMVFSVLMHVDQSSISIQLYGEVGNEILAKYEHFQRSKL